MPELNALVELLAMLVKEPRTGVLFVLLVAAAISDYRTYQIPNWLTFGGIAFGLIYNSIVPFYLNQGFLWALGGLVVGFLIMLPCYVLRIMGAGDVKLMGMVGSLLGLTNTLHAALYSFIAAGITALVFSLYKKALVRMLGNVKDITQMMIYSIIGGFRPEVQIETSQSVGKLPFGVCISIGTIAFVIAKQLSYT